MKKLKFVERLIPIKSLNGLNLRFYSQSESPKLKVKRPKDSFLERTYHFKTDKRLRDSYVNAIGKLRIAKLIEDLDGIAASVGVTLRLYVSALRCYSSHFSHSDGFDERRPLTIVTASCDRILMLKLVDVNSNLRVHAIPCFVGRSSINVRLYVDQENEKGEWEQILHSFWTLVALDKDAKVPVPVNELIPRDEDEMKLYEIGKEMYLKKKEMAKKLITTYELPTEEESKIIHDLFVTHNEYLKSLKQKPKEEMIKLISETKFVYPSTTRLTNSLWMHPQFRNIHNNIYGGFLMKQAYELAFITATNFAGTRIEFLYLDNIQFLHPVHIGDILNLFSEIVFTNPERRLIQVRVKAQTQQPKVGSIKKTTTIFHFTFVSPNREINEIMPQTYKEAMHYLAGRRRYLDALKSVSDYEIQFRFEPPKDSESSKTTLLRNVYERID